MLKQISHGNLRSLVLLDELGVTSTQSKALPLMWALSENLLCLKDSLTMIATHNSYLRRIVSSYGLTYALLLVRYKISDLGQDQEEEKDKKEQVMQDLDPAEFDDQ